MRRRKRFTRLRKHLTYYPAAGVVAFGSMLGMSKASKIKTKERTENSIHLSSDSLSAMRSGLGIVPSVHQLSAADPFRDGAQQEPSADTFLQEAYRRYQRAFREWEQGKFHEAGRSADEGSWLLSGVPAKLDPQQTQIRDALQDRLSELIVLLNEVEAGKDKTGQEPAEQLGPLDLELNSEVQQEIDRFSTTQRSTFLKGFQLAGAHMPYIQKKLVEHGLPKELGWLPLIESGFKLRAQSGAKALGLWQFMPKTGTDLGLKRNRWIDSRMDPEMATEAAMVYLKYLYNTFGMDWHKALAAYNWGEGNVRKAIDRSRKPEDQISFWDLSPRLPEETRRYVPKFLAAVYIVRDPGRFGFHELSNRTFPQRYEMVAMEKQMDMEAVANVLGIAPPTLSDLNPELLQRVTPPQKHLFRVPAGYGRLLLAKMDEIPEYRPQPKLLRPGDIRAASKRRRKGPVLVASAGKARSQIRSPATAAAKAKAKSKAAGPKKSVKSAAGPKSSTRAAAGKHSAKRAKGKKKTRNG